MNRGCVVSLAAGLAIAGAAIGNVAMRTRAAEGADPRASSYMQVTEEDFRTVLARMRAAKDRKSTRLNSSHLVISYAVFCLKKKKTKKYNSILRKKTVTKRI